MFFIGKITSSLILGRSFPHEYRALSSAKLQISDVSTKKKISLMKILNNNGPNIEPCGIPQQIPDYLIYEEISFMLFQTKVINQIL